MLCGGVLPVAQLKDYRPPMRLLAARIPQEVLELSYDRARPRPRPSPPFLLTVLTLCMGRRYGFACAALGSAATDDTREDLEAARMANEAASAVSSGRALHFVTVECIVVNLGRARSWFAVWRLPPLPDPWTR
jgi:hypothetical protein